MSKKVYFSKKPNGWEYRQRKLRIYSDFFLSLYLSSYEWEGVSSEAGDFVMRELWNVGTCCAVKRGEMVLFAPYAPSDYNLYDYPTSLTLAPRRGSAVFGDQLNRRVAVPMADEEAIESDAIILFGHKGREPLRDFVGSKVEDLAEADMAIRANIRGIKLSTTTLWKTNGFNQAAVKRLQLALDAEDDLDAVIGSGDEDMIEPSGASVADYISTLTNHRARIIGDILTYLGIDNASSSEKKERLLTDEANANNELINDSQDSLQINLEEFARRIGAIYGVSVSVRPRWEASESIHDEKQAGKEGEDEGDIQKEKEDDR